MNKESEVNVTREVILAINYRKFDAPPDMLVENARKNKVLLQLLRETRMDERRREEQEKRHREMLDAAAHVAEKLRGLNYAFIKFFKPIAYVPSDIDLILSPDDLKESINRLERGGYKLVVREPYCVTVKKSEIVDLYIHPCVANIPYMNGSSLLDNSRDIQIDSVGSRTLSLEAEVVLTAAHAVYKEQLFTLNDYFTVKRWNNEKVPVLAEATKTMPALNLAFSIARILERNSNPSFPYKINLGACLAIFSMKFLEDSFMRSSIPRIIPKLRNDDRLIASAIARVGRTTY
jgi:hypothetical protein